MTDFAALAAEETMEAPVMGGKRERDLGRTAFEPCVRRAELLADEIAAHCEFTRELARRLCRGHLDHEDLAHDAIERWLRALPAFPAAINHRAWLTTVLRNLFVDRLRRRKARCELAGDCSHMPERERELLPWWIELRTSDVDRELARLPRHQRTTFRLFAFEGKSYEEIAATLGIARATVGTRILRVRSRLKELLTAHRPLGTEAG